MKKNVLILFACLALLSGCTHPSTTGRASSDGAIRLTEERLGRRLVCAHSTGEHAVAGVERDANGKIKRSAAARNAFLRQTGFPKGREGYRVDHIIPLKCGGADNPSNMQWQTIAEAKAKDKIE